MQNWMKLLRQTILLALSNKIISLKKILYWINLNQFLGRNLHYKYLIFKNKFPVFQNSLFFFVVQLLIFVFDCLNVLQADYFGTFLKNFHTFRIHFSSLPRSQQVFENKFSPFLVKPLLCLHNLLLSTKWSDGKTHGN